MSLDGMRRGFVGGSALSLFIIKEFGLERQAAPTLAFLRGYINIEEQLINKIPFILRATIQPFTDYHQANVCFLQIIEILAELQRPPTCEFYWNKEKK